MIYIANNEELGCDEGIILAEKITIKEISPDVFCFRINDKVWEQYGKFLGKDMALKVLDEIKIAIKNGDKFYQIPSLKELLEVYKK